MVVCFYLKQYAKFRKMNITSRPHRDTHVFQIHFFLRLIFSEEISDTFDIEFKYQNIIQ